MSVISLTPEQLREQSKVYTQARDGVEAQRARVKNMNNQIAQQWKGAAFQSYLQQYAQLEQQVIKFENLLVEINQQLTKYADTVAQRDQQDARSFGLL